jgi:peptide/nickel transport system substrate-binding protein
MTKFIDLENLLNQGKITRREFVNKITAIGLTAAISPALLTAHARALTPKNGGRFRIGMAGGNVSDTLDPHTFLSAMPMLINYQLRNCLVEINADNEVVSELAESWEAGPGAKEWVFKLRKGVEFHNGKTLMAEDVVASIDYHRGENSKSVVKSQVDQIEDLRTDGKYTVIFKLKTGNADFPFLLGDYHMVIFPIGTKNFDAGIGTGPFKLELFEPGVRTFTVRNNNYFKPGMPHFDEIETIHLPDVNSRISALSSNQIDAMMQVGPKNASLIEKKTNINILRTPSGAHYTMPMRCDTPPYNNNDVRLALKNVINREQMLDIILRGFGVLGNDHSISSNLRFHNDELPQRTYDPDKARYHLKKANMLDHVFELHTADTAFTGAVDAAILYSEQAKKAGVKIKVVREPADGYWENVWKKKPWCTSMWYGRPTEDWMFTIAYAANSTQNDTFWKHERFNKLLIEARAELDNTKRRAMYFEMQQILHDEGGVVIPLFADHIAAASKKVKHGKLAGNMELDGLKCCERWWFDS